MWGRVRGAVRVDFAGGECGDLPPRVQYRLQLLGARLQRRVLPVDDEVGHAGPGQNADHSDDDQELAEGEAASVSRSQMPIGQTRGPDLSGLGLAVRGLTAS